MRKAVLLAAISVITLNVFANDNEDSLELAHAQQVFIDSIESSLHYKTGTISLGDGVASLIVPPGYTFIDGAEARFVLEDLWGNLKDEKPPMGMLFPPGSTATKTTFAFVVLYNAVGYVKDGDAGKIDYDDLLVEIRKDQDEANKQRKSLGMEQMSIIGWAKKPYYDSERKVLHWAKEISVEGYDENTLNYDIIFLGRKGILMLEAISDMSYIDSVNKDVNSILGMVAFTPGNQYKDFNSKTDDVAAWTIGGLVAGKLLAKAGFFALILKNIKLVILGLVALGGGAWRFIRGRKKKQDEYVYEPQTITSDNTPPTG